MGDGQSFVVCGSNKLQGRAAADALTEMIDNANIDDIYAKLTFTVAEQNQIAELSAGMSPCPETSKQENLLKEK